MGKLVVEYVAKGVCIDNRETCGRLERKRKKSEGRRKVNNGQNG